MPLVTSQYGILGVNNGVKPEAIADPFVTTKDYAKGDLVMNNGYLYSALNDIEAGDWDATKWLKTNVAKSIGEVYSTEETPIGKWIDGSTIYRRIVRPDHRLSTSGWDTISADFGVKDVYRCTVESSVFNNGHCFVYNAACRVYDGNIQIFARELDCLANDPIIIEYTKN